MSRRLIVPAGCSLAVLVALALGALVLGGEGETDRRAAAPIEVARVAPAVARASRPVGSPGTVNPAPGVSPPRAGDTSCSTREETARSTHALADDGLEPGAVVRPTERGLPVTSGPSAAAPSPAARALLGELADPDPEVRRDALLVLGESEALDQVADEPAIVATVVDLARRDASAEVRREACRLLALGDAIGHEIALRALSGDSDEGVRANACLGLARGGDERARERLAGFGRSPDVERALEDAALHAIAGAGVSPRRR